MPHASSGSSLYTAKEIAERVLRKIGRFAIHDEAADADDLKETLYQMDMMLAHYAAKRPRFVLRRDELSITLVEADASYNLREELNTQLPTGVQFAVEAMLDDGDGNRRPLEIITHREFRRIDQPERTGTPEVVFIDRTNNPVLRVWPIPTENEDGWTLVLTVQTFGPTVRPRNINRDTALTNQPTGLEPSWQLWAVEKLAAICGDGPVIKRPDQEIQRWHAQANLYEAELMAYENREHENTPPMQQPSVYQ